MKLGTIVKYSFIGSVIMSFIGAYFKIIHNYNIYETILAMGIVLAIIFIASAIYEVCVTI